MDLMDQAKFWDERSLDAIKAFAHGNPHELLGMHYVKGEEALVIRVLCPRAKKMVIVNMQDRSQAYHIDGRAPSGFFEYIIHNRRDKFLYEVHWEDEHNNWHSYIDPYQFESTITSEDLYLFGMGSDYELYHKMGAHLMTVDGIEGVRFLVWAPRAVRVSVIGDFNNWDGRMDMMRCISTHGVWEIFIPGLKEGTVYKYEVFTKHGANLDKTDPYGNYYEKRPSNASIVFNDNDYQWKDGTWIKERATKNPKKEPISIYEMHLGSWRQHPDGTHYTYREIAPELASYAKDMGYTHIELMGIMEHPFDGSWGYQVTGYFAPTSRFGTPDDFKFLVDTLHQNGIGMILDWVPAHFPKDAFALERFDGEPLYEHSDPKQANHPHWGTLIFDYGKPQVSLFLINSALSWFEKYHVDALRVDAVASMLYLDYGRGDDYVRNRYGGKENLEAIEFMKHLNSIVKKRVPGVMTMAEESTSFEKVSYPAEEGGLGFDFKWNMGWMNDYLSYIETPSLFREWEHGKITFSLMYAFSENFIQVFSHDEVVHGKRCMLYKMPGDMKEKYATLKATYGYMYAHPGKKMLFMGNDMGVVTEWNENVELDWGLLNDPNHKGIHDFVRALNKMYKHEPALWETNEGYGNFEWMDCGNGRDRTVIFTRRAQDPMDELLVAVNFSGSDYKNYRIPVPTIGTFKEILNSEDKQFNGSGMVNHDEIKSELEPWHGRDMSMVIDLPACSIVIFKPVSLVPQDEIEKMRDAKIAADMRAAKIAQAQAVTRPVKKVSTKYIKDTKTATTGGTATKEGKARAKAKAETKKATQRKTTKVVKAETVVKIEPIKEIKKIEPKPTERTRKKATKSSEKLTTAKKTTKKTTKK